MQLDSTNTAAVDPSYHWIPIESCPHNVKVQLLGDGVAQYGVYRGDGFFTHWCPLPTLKKD